MYFQQQSAELENNFQICYNCRNFGLISALIFFKNVYNAFINNNICSNLGIVTNNNHIDAA